MSFVAAAAELTEHALPIPAFTYGVIGAIGFIVLGFVTWSFRDVAHRHGENIDPQAGDHLAAPGSVHHSSGQH